MGHADVIEIAAQRHPGRLFEHAAEDRFTHAAQSGRRTERKAGSIMFADKIEDGFQPSRLLSSRNKRL